MLAKVREHVLTEVFLPCSTTILSSLGHIAAQPGQHFRGLLGHFTLDMVQNIDCLFPSPVEHNPWTALIYPIWADIIQYVDAAWCAGDACQDMDPSAERLPLFTPVVMQDETHNPRVEKQCHRYASRNAPSPLASPPSARVQ